MLHDLASRLGYSPLGFGFAALWFLYTAYFVVSGLAALIYNQFGQLVWLDKLRNYDRWGYWNPIDIMIFAWHGWWVSTLIALILSIFIEAIAWLSLSGFLHLLPQVGSVVALIITLIVGVIAFFDP